MVGNGSDCHVDEHLCLSLSLHVIPLIAYLNGTRQLCSTFRSDVALIYNDRAVLENHHVSAAFRLLRMEEFNIVSEFTSDEYK